MRSARPMQKTVKGMRKWLSVRTHLMVAYNVIDFPVRPYAVDWRQHTEAALALSMQPALRGVGYHGFRDEFVPDHDVAKQRIPQELLIFL
jgi:hypothetical protein